MDGLFEHELSMRDKPCSKNSLLNIDRARDNSALKIVDIINIKKNTILVWTI